jgi:putative immunity protein/bacteriocin
MRKRNKAILSLLMAVALVLTPVNSTLAATRNSSEQLDSINLIQETLDSVGYDATSSALSNGESKSIWNKIDKKLKDSGFYVALDDNGYCESTQICFDPVKVVDDQFSEYYAYFFMKVYENDLGEQIFALFVYDKNTDSLLRLEAEKMDQQGDLDTFFNYSEYNKTVTNEAGEITTMSFSVWGANFACSMAGVIACGAYCAMIGAATGGIGAAICSILCGTAFAAACS